MAKHSIKSKATPRWAVKLPLVDDATFSINRPDQISFQLKRPFALSLLDSLRRARATGQKRYGKDWRAEFNVTSATIVIDKDGHTQLIRILEDTFVPVTVTSREQTSSKKDRGK